MWILNEKDERVIHLCYKDHQISKLVPVLGEITFPMEPNYFEAIVKRIIGQQLSNKVADVIWSRLKGEHQMLNPEHITSFSDDVFKKAGISMRKITSIRDFTQKIQTGEIDLQNIHLFKNEEVKEILTQIKGIGNWTAEMFLIFSLGRENVLSKGDATLKKAIKWLYPNDESISSDVCFEKWSPYCTIASLYLWESVNRGIAGSML